MRSAKEHNEIPIKTNWGGIFLRLGILSLLLAATCVAAAWYGSIATIGTDGTTDFRLMRAAAIAAGLFVPLAAIGGLLTVLGLIFRKPSLTKRRDDVTTCSGCGRENALTTKVCPRCETRIE